MYEIMTAVFTVILGLSVYGMIKYGFNLVLIYIGIFSLVIVAWGITAITGEKKKD
jgi:hypothetical protein